MNWKSRILLLVLLATLFVHGYLTFHYYQLNFGMVLGSSSCNLSDVFSCDTASASRFSNIFGVPLAIFGGVTNLLLLFLFIGFVLRWSEHPARLGRYCLYLATFVALMSLVMAGISLFVLKSFCPYCMAAYGLSFISLFLFWRLQEGPVSGNLKEDLLALPSEGRPVAISFFVGIPVLSGLFHVAMLGYFNVRDLDSVVKASVADWMASPLVKFDDKASLRLGASAETARMTIVEFADFRCGHCKQAAPSLHAFVKAHPDVRFLFFNFPLDGACNPTIQRSLGPSCQLAKSVHCAQQQDKGWELHRQFFDQQETLASYISVDSLNEEIKKIAQNIGIDWEKLSACTQSEETHKAIMTQAKIGDLAQVEGTPAIFANGRKLRGGHLIPVLEEVYKRSK